MTQEQSPAGALRARERDLEALLARVQAELVDTRRRIRRIEERAELAPCPALGGASYVEPREVRAWAIANGHLVATAGRIRGEVIAAYLAARPPA